jgi:hypothetical protein
MATGINVLPDSIYNRILSAAEGTKDERKKKGLLHFQQKKNSSEDFVTFLGAIHNNFLCVQSYDCNLAKMYLYFMLALILKQWLKL